MNERGKKIELLAPAGNLQSGIIAFKFGADAVYCGLKKFNARDRAENFSFEELARIITFAHEHSKKVYIAFNILIKESEIPEAAINIAKIAELSPDAVIVQDLGVLKIIRDFFPSLNIHASTQMAIHNSFSAKIAKELGISRVILERQLTLDEIRQISENSPVETEVFIHGALCCSLSGQCLLSSWFGGCSGNRGKCKQACRFPSFLRDSYYPLSTRDLAVVDDIFELKKIKNLVSFKIEGRLRSADYIANLVSAYRILLDANDNDKESALKEAKKIMKFSYGRDYTPVFKKNFNTLINPLISGTSGIKCAEVKKIADNGFYAFVYTKLHLGDKIRIQDENGSYAVSLTIKKMFSAQKELKSARHGEIVFIPTDRKVRNLSSIFKIGESIYENSAKIARLPINSTFKLFLKINIEKDFIEVRTENLIWKKEYHFQMARNQILTEQKIREIFSDTASKKFSSPDMEVYLRGNLFAPLSHLKQIRREFWNWANENIDPTAKNREKCSIGLQKFLEFYDKLKKEDEYKENFFLLDSELKRYGNKQFEIPFFCSEKHINKLILKIQSAYDKSYRIFRATSLAHFEILKKYKDILIIASFPLQCANSLAACEIRKLGARIVQAWVELEKRELEFLLQKSPVQIEIFREGRIPIFFTRGKIDGNFCEIRGTKIPLKKEDEGITTLFSPEIFKIPSVMGCFEYVNYYGLARETDKISTFNFYRDWK